MNLTPERSYNSNHVIRASREVLNELMWNVSEDKDAIGELAMPCLQNERFRSVLALDQVKFPVNLAMLMHTASILKCSHVFFIHGCCDLFNWKVLQKTRAAWKIPTIHGSVEDLMTLCKKHQHCRLSRRKTVYLSRD